MNYYNENDPKAAAWLRELIECGEIPDGRVDVRSICDVTANDLTGFVQCHWFAGIGGWSYALRLAGWSANKSIWTGSCPCQPFSAAGKGKGELDERHLWPAFFNLIQKCRPELVFGEQVASAIGHGWLDGICSDLEKENYAIGHCVLGAHSVGAPHIRQRLYWVAYSSKQRTILPCGSGGLSILESVEVEVSQKGLCLQGRRQESGEHLYAPHDTGHGEGKGNFRPHKQEQIGQQKGESQGCNAIREQSQSNSLDGRSCEKQGENSMDGEASYKQEVSMVGIVRDERGGDQGACGSISEKESDNARDGRLADAKCHAGEPGRTPIESREGNGEKGERPSIESGRCGNIGRLVNSHNSGSQGRERKELRECSGEQIAGTGSASDGMGNTKGDDERRERKSHESDGWDGENRRSSAWSDSEFIPCRDGKQRRLKSGLEPLVARLPGSVVPGGDPSLPYCEATAEARVMRLKGYGNSIVPQVAAEFIQAFLEVR